MAIHFLFDAVVEVRPNTTACPVMLIYLCLSDTDQNGER